MLHTVCCPLTGITICGNSNMLKCVYFINQAKYEKKQYVFKYIYSKVFRNLVRASA